MIQNVVVDEQYVPVPPYRGRWWPKLLNFYAPHMLRKKYGITQIDCIHDDRLKASLSAGHGVLLAPNHSRDEDPIILSSLSRCVGSPFFIMASWHLFKQDKFKTFLLRRAGAFSVYREGIDRVAVNTAVEMLATAERPLVIFPEGMISRTNDKLNSLLEGTALIARSAAKKRAKLEPPKKVVIHPIALRYRFQGDVQTAAAKVLDEIERRLTWRPLRDMPLLDRIYKTGGALLALKEIEYMAHASDGDVAPRLTALIEAILAPLEDQWLKERHSDAIFARIKRLRTAILPDMINGELDEAERDRRWKQLADLYLCQQLFHYPPEYARSNPTPHRLLETIERFEEDLTDHIRVHGPMHATITVGEAIEVAPAREGRGSGGDPLMDQLEQQLQAMVAAGGISRQ